MFTIRILEALSLSARFFIALETVLSVSIRPVQAAVLEPVTCVVVTVEARENCSETKVIFDLKKCEEKTLVVGRVTCSKDRGTARMNVGPYTYFVGLRKNLKHGSKVLWDAYGEPWRSYTGDKKSRNQKNKQ